ncbi:TIGR04282 family arsenosugar biosynthesis glycosyltransferase [Lysobacter xanthus]
MSCAVAIFVKTPVLSSVKSRLWPAIGRQTAEALYLLSAEAVASVACEARQSRPLEPYWAVAEPEALDGDAWADLAHVPQGEGGLGERMASVHGALLERHGAALLIGADAPQITADHLRSAAGWLAAPGPRLVIGRADDGGFWLFGANVAIPTHAWTSVAYSCDDTAEAFRAAVGDVGLWRELPVLRDLDTEPDLTPVLEALDALPAATPSQRRLAAWLSRLQSGAAPATPSVPATIQLAV